MVTKFVFAVVAISIAIACNTDIDCSLNGICGSDNICTCDDQWYGEYCDLLRILPTIKDNGFRQANYSSWGGSIIYDNTTNTYNMFVARMSLHCGLNSWKTNSEIVHAISNDNPLGPYTYKSTILPRFAHNPTIHYFNQTNTYYLYHIGCGHNTTSPITDCINGSTPNSMTSIYKSEGDSCDGPHWSGLLSSKSINGPWIAAPKEIELITNHSSNWTTNPCVLIEDNSTIIMVYRQPAQEWPYVSPPNATSERLGISVSNGYTFDGPFRSLTDYEPIENFPLEDAYIWKDFRGNYHMITHKKDPDYGPDDGTGGHLYSIDGINWNISRNSPYNNTIVYIDGSFDTVSARARPQLFIEGGRVKYVSTGVKWGHSSGDYTFTVVQPVYWP